MLPYRVILAGLLLGSGCSTDPGDTTDDPACAGGKCDYADDGDEAANLCVALRGNGDRIFGLITGVARVIEDHGLVVGSAGGSSASITTFFVETVHANPMVHECGDKKCSDEDAAARAALLLKATQGYFEVLSRSDEALAFQTLAPLASRFQEAGLQGLLEEDPAAARTALEDLLTSEDLKDLINDEVLETIRNSPNPAFHVQDFVDTASGFGSFAVTDEKVLIRPGFVDFEKTAEKIGRIGTFLAGDEPVDQYAMATFLDDCGAPGRGLNWPEVAKLKSGKTTCGEALATMVEAFRDEMKTGDYDSRIDRPMGEGFHAIVATSVLTGDAVGTWEAARAAYLKAEEWEWSIDFEDVKLGYFGNKTDLASMEANPMGYKDAKTRKFMSLGQVTWREALTYSPAEPGIARALEIDAESVSAGGWPDLHPVLGLKNVGCDKVVYVSRSGTESQFALRMADTALQAKPEQVQELYSLDHESGFALSLAEADAVLCTKWDELPGLDLPTITGSVWSEAPLVTDDPVLADADDNSIPTEGAPTGCALPSGK